ncbi:MAG: DNA recombination protein RmuC [Bacteroidales bacterium]|nr:DNA recombination protein RmuC [Bacteroidales bacterium]
METTTIIILAVAVAAVIVAVLLTRALTKSRVEAAGKAVQVRLETELEHIGRDKGALEEELSKVRESVPGQIAVAVEAAEKAKDAVIQAREEAHRQAMEDLRSRFDETIEKVSAQVKVDTEQMLKERQREFSASSGEAIAGLMKPVREKMEDLRKAMEENSTVHKTAESAIKSDVSNLMQFAGRVSKSADQLAAAFKHGNKFQGIWGETILEELLSSQGLTEGIHFDVQPTIVDSEGRAVRNEDGSIMRPDVIIHLDTRREVIVDAKTSLSAYVNYVNAENEEDRERSLKAHIESIRNHVKELAKKDYASYIQPPKCSAGYVIMFVPNMGALWAALNAEPDLWRWAAEQNVYIADEQSLYGALRIVQLTWTQVQQEQNHEKVFALAGEMVDRVEKVLSSYENIGRALDAAKKAYDEGHRKLEPHGQSIVTTAIKLTKLGAKKGKVLEKIMLDIDDIPALEEGDRE